MFTAADFDALLKELELRFQQEQREHTHQYQRDRQALEGAREVTLRLSGVNGSLLKEQPRPQANAPSSLPVAATTSGRGRTNRDLVREVVLKMPGDFTLREVIVAAQRDPDAAVRSLTENTLQSTMGWFKKYKLVEVVCERQSKTEGSLYRLASANLKRPAIISKRNSDFPLLDMAAEAINSLSVPAFGRAEVFQRLKEMFPQYAERIKIDSVGATLVKLGATGKIRCATRDHHGNTYEKL